MTTVCIPRIVRNTDQLAEMIAAADTLKLNWHLQTFSVDGGDPLTEDEARKRIGDGRLAWFIITERS